MNNIGIGAELNDENSTLINSSDSKDPVTEHINQWSTSLGLWSVGSMMTALIQIFQYGTWLPKTDHLVFPNFLFFALLIYLTFASIIVSVITTITAFKVRVLYINREQQWAKGANDVITNLLGNLSIATVVISIIFTAIIIVSYITIK